MEVEHASVSWPHLPRCSVARFSRWAGLAGRVFLALTLVLWVTIPGFHPWHAVEVLAQAYGLLFAAAGGYWWIRHGRR